MEEDWFEPGPGRARADYSLNRGKYLDRVIASARRREIPKTAGPRRFTGALIGRGSVAARLLHQSDRFAWASMRRAIVKTRIVRLDLKGMNGARAHFRYIQRDGVTREGHPGTPYSGTDDAVDGREFLERSRSDRHQFRIVISVEDGPEYEDLKPLVRRFALRMGEDLGTRLEWLAADHVDTMHPHTHMVLRGIDELGHGLVIAPEYMNEGMRRRIAELVSIDLGPKSEIELPLSRRVEVQAERLTLADRKLLQEMDADRIVSPSGTDMSDHSAQVGRLRKLHALGLSRPLSNGRWHLSDDMEGTLRSLDQRNEIIAMMRRELVSAGIERRTSELAIYEPELGSCVTGKVVLCGRAERGNGQFIIVDAVDGRSHYVAIGDERAEFSVRSIVRIRPGHAHEREQEDLSDRNELRELADDMHSTVGRDKRVDVELLSAMPLESLANHHGPTWLDRTLIAQDLHPRDAGFGRAVRSALTARRIWLIEQGLARGEGTAIEFRGDLLSELRQREILRAGERISRETGLAYVALPEDATAAGRPRRALILASGCFAMVENGREFSLVPWNLEHERVLGKDKRPTFTAETINFRALVRGRGLEI